MLEEIRQQPAVLERSLAGRSDALARLRARFSLSRPRLIVIAARGTSDNAAIFGRYLFEITLGIPTSLAAPSVATLYRRQATPRDALVVGISQSGESTDINSYLELAKSGGSLTVGITNEAESAMASLADEVLLTQAGRERSVAATKTYTAQMLMVYRLAVTLGAQIPAGDLESLPAAVASQLRHEDAVAEVASRFRAMTKAVVVGRGLNFANGLEFALKLMETCYVVATGFSAADFAHGPIAMLEEGFPAFVFTSPGPTLAETRKLLDRLDRLGADTVCIGAEADARGRDRSHWMELHCPAPMSPSYPADTLTAIPAIVPAQLFAAHLSEAKGLNPDKPRSLTKVTRTL